MRWAFVLIFSIVVIGFAIDTALQPPHFTTEFKAGSTIDSRHGRILLQNNDLVKSPSSIKKYSEVISFFERQNLISLITSDSTIKITHNGQEEIFTSRKKNLADLPLIFWVQIFTGLIALALALRFYSLRPFDVTTGYFGIAGVCVFVSLVAAAVYTTRLLALPTLHFHMLQQLNLIGSSLFGICFITLFIIYPAQTPGWKFLANLQSFIFSAWTALIIIHVVPEWALSDRMISVQMLVLCLCILVQLIMTQPRSPARSQLIHLGGPIFVAAGGLAYLNLNEALTFQYEYIFLFIMGIYAFNRWSKV